MRFNDKSILITGAAGGIGRAAAVLMAGEGGKILVADIDEVGGEETVSIIRTAGGQAYFVPTDVTKKAALERAVVEAVDRHGGLDVAVNNAGVGGDLARTHQYKRSTYDRVIAVNQTAVFEGMQVQLEAMLPAGCGVIVNVASMAGLMAQPKTSAYVASKHAVIGLTKTAAREYAKYGIRINAVCPVYTQTQMVDELFGKAPGLDKMLQAQIPMKRYARPEEIAEAIAWLASDQSSFATGLCLPMDGGLSA